MTKKGRKGAAQNRMSNLAWQRLLILSVYASHKGTHLMTVV